MTKFEITPIGIVRQTAEGSFIVLEHKYIPAIQAIDGFSHLNIVWCFSNSMICKSRSMITTRQPYKGAPEVMGVFATRSPQRPNPIALTACEVIHIDHEKGIIQVTFIDADDQTPVLDIKPYTPSFDRVESPRVPDWCKFWPKSTEESGLFDWGSVFNF